MGGSAIDSAKVDNPALKAIVERQPDGFTTKELSELQTMAKTGDIPLVAIEKALELVGNSSVGRGEITSGDRLTFETLLDDMHAAALGKKSEEKPGASEKKEVGRVESEIAKAAINGLLSAIF